MKLPPEFWLRFLDGRWRAKKLQKIKLQEIDSDFVQNKFNWQSHLKGSKGRSVLNFVCETNVTQRSPDEGAKVKSTPSSCLHTDATRR